MKRQPDMDKESFASILPDYGKRKLMTYADSIRELALNLEDNGNEEPGDKECREAVDRRAILWQKKLSENKSLMVDQLREMSKIMMELAKENRRCVPMSSRRFKQIAHAFKEMELQLKNLYLIENENGRTEISVTLKSKGKNPLSSDEVGDLLSVLLGTHLSSRQDNKFFLSEGFETLYYVEESRFHTLTGVAKAVKETEQISGDNYSFFEMETGNLTAVLSDGMGSGDKACADSTMVVELVQRFLEAGFQMEMAIQMINSILLSGGEQSNMSTLDVCSLDLYSGECHFIKVGSSSSYIKRQHLVDRISSGNLPLGIFQKPDVESIGRTLMDGDYIIMISDGILDALSQGIGEDMLSEFIGSLTVENPGEMANTILRYCIQQSRGHIRDDMTVMVIGIWERNADGYSSHSSQTLAVGLRKNMIQE